MVVFTRTDNTIEVDFDNLEKHYISPTSTVQGKSGSDEIIVAEILQGGNSGRKYNIKITNINGRPSDDAMAVAEWLRDTYFFGDDYSIAPSAGGTATATNQATQIARADTIIVDLADLAAKTASAKVAVPFDEKVIVFSDAANGVIDYVRYNLLGVEVARDTLSYDGFGNIDGIT